MKKEKDMTKKKLNESQLCTMCSHWSDKKEWLDDKCPLCKQILILADMAGQCPYCGALSRKQDISGGKCPKCR